MTDNPFTADQLDEPVQDLTATTVTETLTRLCAYAAPAVIQELAQRGPGVVKHVIELSDRIRTLEAELAQFKAVARKIPIIRTGEPGTEQWLTCIGCQRSGSDNCAPDCWAYELEGLMTDET